VALARVLRRSYVLLEDGFLRSVARDAPSLSLLVDDIGCYYDATAPSRMELAIAAGATRARPERARALVAQWRAAGFPNITTRRTIRATCPRAMCWRSISAMATSQ
jgi:capsular polysaccharide export protein